MAHLGKWQLVAEIARGGTGIVYLAIPRGSGPDGKLYVLKQLKPEHAEDETAVEAFLEEARQAARLAHPNIVTIHDVDVDERRPFVVMDYLEGVTLARLVRRRNPQFTLGAHLRVICEALSGLHYAHASAKEDEDPLGDLHDGTPIFDEDRGPRSMPRVVIHRDASPQNVFITYTGEVLLVDFGIARASPKPRPQYLAPEQLEGAPRIDARADVFAIGVMIWEAIAGKRMDRVDGAVPSLSDAAPDAPAQIVRIVEKALMKAPEDRYASAAHLRIDLEGFLMNTGKKTTTGDVGKIVAEMFAAERVTVKQTIAEQLTRVAQRRGDSSSSKLPSLPPPSADPLEPSHPSPQATPASLTNRPAPIKGPPAAIAKPLPPRPAPRPKKGGKTVIVLLVALLLLGGAFAVLHVRLGLF